MPPQPFESTARDAQAGVAQHGASGARAEHRDDPIDSWGAWHWRGVGSTAFFEANNASSMLEPESSRGASPLGDDDFGHDGFGHDGPGERTGIYRLAEDEAVGVIVVRDGKARRSSDAPEAVLSLAGRREDLLFLLESQEPEIKFLRLNVVATQGATALAELLETLDFRPNRRLYRPSVDALARWGGGPLLSLMAWRQREGLRRSIDWGTRWLLFELHHARLRRRAEREARAFLYRLSRLGLLEEPSPGRRFEVYCLAQRVSARGEKVTPEFAPSVVLRVRAPLRREFEDALSDTQAMVAGSGDRSVNRSEVS